MLYQLKNIEAIKDTFKKSVILKINIFKFQISSSNYVILLQIMQKMINIILIRIVS